MERGIQMRWDLSNIYESFECEKFTKDFKLLRNRIHDIDSWMKVNFQDKDNAEDKIKYFIEFKNEACDLVYKLGGFSYLTSAADTKNISANQNFNKVLVFEQKIKSAENEFQSWLLKIDNIHEIIHNSEYLKDYGFYLHELIDDGKHIPSKAEGKLLGRMKGVSSNAWEGLFRTIISNHKVEIDLNKKKESLTLQAAQSLSNSDDPEIRKKAFGARCESYSKIADTVTWAYNSIKGEQIIESELKGYDSVLQMAMKGYRLKEETLHTMFKTIKKYLPVIQRGIIHKAKLLGYNNALPFYDLYAPLGNLEKVYSFDEVKSIILGNLKNYGGRLYTIAEKAFSENWIDAEPREGKRNGGFCTNIHSVKQSRILFNFTGRSDNILQLSHEIGHAYHHDCLNTQSCINSVCSLAIMESAAIFSENFLQKRILDLSPQEEKLNILNGLLLRDVRLISDIYAYFTFETKVFEIRKERILSQDELCSLLDYAFSGAYGDSIEKETIDKYAWMALPQLFYSSRPYYMVSYVFGLLFTKGLYSQYLKDKDKFAGDFEHFLAISGKYSVEDAAAQLNTDINSEEFWENSLKIVEEEIDAFIQESDIN